MVLTCEHLVLYKIVFDKPVDYFDVFLQKQIDLRKKIEINENCVIVKNLTFDKQFLNSDFIKKYSDVFFNYRYFKFSYLNFNNSPEKYKYIKLLYNDLLNNNLDSFLNKDFLKMSYEEFEYNIEQMLEEFKLFLDKFEFDLDDKKIIEAFTLDEKIKSNIKFIGWIDYFT